MQNAVRKLILLGITNLMILVSCSPHDSSNIPIGPPVQIRGRIALINESGVSIRVVGYTQTRGETQMSVNLGIHLAPGQDYYLHNLIETNMGQVFLGGDIVQVDYVAEEPDPDHPSQPLFRDSVTLTVNGTFYIQVKNGGSYSIYPG